MKKNIVVLVSDIANDYSFSVLDGITNFFADKNVNLIIISARMGQDLPSKQSIVGIKLTETDRIDGIIVLTAVFLSRISIDDLAKTLGKVKTDNILSISTQIPIKGSAYTYVDCKSAYDKIINHLINEHNCKRFAFMSAMKTGSKEAKERFDAFKSALEKNGLKFDENLLFEGYFVYDRALAAIQERYKKKEDVNFDAILCANDMMAFASINALEQLNLKVPDDIKVFGYDDIIQAQTAELTLSTINQQMEKQGQTAAELVWKKANGETIPTETPISIKPIFRKSCGCSSTESDFLDKMQKHTGNRNMSVSLHLEKNMIQQNIYFLLETLQNEMTLDMLFEMMDSILPNQYIPGITVCMYDKPLLVSDEEPFALPEKATVKVYIDKNCGIKKTNINETFDPHKMILPAQYFAEGSCTYLIHPIFFGHKQYGYIVCKSVSTEYLFAMIYLQTFSTIISQSYIYTMQLEENAKLTSENLMLQIDNSELNQISMIDSLTGVFNRRGLISMGNEALHHALKTESQGIVFFADMDFLKKINDEYGHDMGDTAIKLEAKIFKTIFRSSDIIARLGGDEFAGVIPGLPISHLERTQNNLTEACKKISKENNLPFEISISLGAVEFNKENCNLENLIKLADIEQYKIKRLHHRERQ